MWQLERGNGRGRPARSAMNSRATKGLLIVDVGV